MGEACFSVQERQVGPAAWSFSLHESEPRSSSADTCKAYWWIGAQHQGHEAEWQQAVCGSAELPCQMRYQLLSHGAVPVGPDNWNVPVGTCQLDWMDGVP